MAQGFEIGTSEGVFGERLGRHFNSVGAPTIVTRAGADVRIAATRLTGTSVVTTPIPRDDAYILAFQMADIHKPGLWMANRAIDNDPQLAGTFSVVHLEEEPRAELREAFDCLDFYIPRLGLSALVEEAELLRAGELSCRVGTSYDDPIVRHLALSLMPTITRPRDADQLFADHVMNALHLHLATAYGGVDTSRMLRPHGLAPWQIRRATERLSAGDAARLPLAELAAECGLSRSHFGRAFKRSMGLTPHQWLARHRIRRAQAMLLDARLSLGEIAQIVGFADQSHFTRAFREAIGETPAVWRRLRRQ